MTTTAAKKRARKLRRAEFDRCIKTKNCPDAHSLTGGDCRGLTGKQSGMVERARPKPTTSGRRFDVIREGVESVSAHRQVKHEQRTGTDTPPTLDNYMPIHRIRATSRAEQRDKKALKWYKALVKSFQLKACEEYKENTPVYKRGDIARENKKGKTACNKWIKSTIPHVWNHLTRIRLERLIKIHPENRWLQIKLQQILLDIDCPHVDIDILKGKFKTK